MIQLPTKVDLHRFQVDISAVWTLPEEFARRYELIPVRFVDSLIEETALSVVVDQNIPSSRLESHITNIIRQCRVELHPDYMAPVESIMWAIGRYYNPN